MSAKSSENIKEIPIALAFFFSGIVRDVWTISSNITKLRSISYVTCHVYYPFMLIRNMTKARLSAWPQDPMSLWFSACNTSKSTWQILIKFDILYFCWHIFNQKTKDHFTRNLYGFLVACLKLVAKCFSERNCFEHNLYRTRNSSCVQYIFSISVKAFWANKKC
jgi:hypothetical protein